MIFKKLFPFIIIILLLMGCTGYQPNSLETTSVSELENGLETPTDDVITDIPQSTEEPTPFPTLIPYETPAWFENAVLYEIFVRSFADSDGDGVGDLTGITENLDFLVSLKVDVIWLLPIYPSPSVHGYDVTDYYDVNPDYGTFQDLVELVNAAHERNMKIILDFVPSHLSNHHPWFQDAYKNTESEYSEWFVWTNDSHSLYAGFANNESMPRFNHYNPEVVDFLIENAKFWLDLDGDGDYSDGIDGFRVDNVTFPPEEFFIAFRQGIKAANPDALILGEAWVHTPSDLNRYFDQKFDALFDFPFYELMQGNHDFNGDGLLAGKGYPVLLTSLLNESIERYPDQSAVVRFLNNHDTNRLATELGGDFSRLKLAAAVSLSMPGPVMLYYGEEIGMLGQKGGPPHWDNYRREPFDWQADETGPGQTTWFKPPDRWNSPDDGVSVEEQISDPDSLLNYYIHLLDIRKNSDALQGETMEILKVDETTGPGSWVAVRGDDDQEILLIYNFSTEEIEITFNEFPLAFPNPIDLITAEELEPIIEGEPLIHTLSPGSAMWIADN